MADENPTPPPDQQPPFKINVTVDDIGAPPRPEADTPSARKMAVESSRTVYYTLQDEGVPRIICALVSGAILGITLAIGTISTAITWVMVTIAEPVGLQLLEGLEQMRKGIDPVIPQMAAEILGELTGADIKTEHVPTGKGFGDHLARVNAVGNELHNLLTAEFTPDGIVSPEQGAKAARTFTGFNINFGIGTAMIAILGEIESLGKLEQVRELGVEVARNLGLGRLHRQALQPLIHTVIANPYQSFLNEKYRPTHLSTAQALKAFFREAINEPTLRSELAHAGYTEERIDQIITDARPEFSISEQMEIFFRGSGNLDTLKAGMRHIGWQDYQTELLLDNARPQLEKAEIIHLYEGGEIELPEALALLAKLGYDDKTAHRVITAYELAHEAHVKPPRIKTRKLSLGELHKMYLDAVIDLPTYQQKLELLGFTEDDTQLIELQTLLDQKHSKATSTTHAAPHLNVSQLKAALAGGIMSPVDVLAHLKAMRYSDADAEVLLAEMETAVTKAANKATPPSGG